MNDCIFCAIAGGRATASVVYRDDALWPLGPALARRLAKHADPETLASRQDL